MASPPLKCQAPIVEMRAATAPTRMPKGADGLAIAWRMWGPKTRHYVAQVKGEGGVDWGYTEKRSEAKPLSRYWQRRFASDCRAVGSEARFEETEVTDAMFRMPRGAGDSSEVVAVFPGLPGSPGMMLCYQHVGQHGSCSREWLRTTRPATLLELQPLRRELESIGYTLRAVGRMTEAHRKQRRALGG